MHYTDCIQFFSMPGVRDNSSQMGMPPMQAHQRVENLAVLFRNARGLANRSTSNQKNKKRKRPELDREEQDMEVEEDGNKDLFKLQGLLIQDGG